MCDKKSFGRLAETSAVRHSPEGVPVDAVADVMGRLISQGLIRGWGMSQVSAETKFEGDDVRRWVPQLSKENILANQPILDVLSDCARKKGATNAQLSLAWMLPGKFLTKLEARKNLKPIIKSRLDHRPACFHPHYSAEIHKP